MDKDRKLSNKCTDFIDDQAIEDILQASRPDPARVKDIISKSLSKSPLTVEETAVLLNTDDPELLEEIFSAARILKKEVYGNRIVIFAPLYIGNHCVNNCSYCGFKKSSSSIKRMTLSPMEIERQVKALERVGHKRLILVFGEHPSYDSEFISKTVDKVYSVTADNGEIRRVNINAAPMNTAGFKRVKEAGIGTYQIFQETYHHQTYARMHPENTLKGDYLYRLDGLTRAYEAGCDDVGIGALFGLYDYKFDTLGLVSHAAFLLDRFGCGPHTISFPRLRPAENVSIDDKYSVSDHDFKKLVAILRLAVPYTGMILTARESPEIRKELMGFGVSQIDAGSNIEMGGYSKGKQNNTLSNEQFSLGDTRGLDEIILELLENEYIPSFCTSCYRLGRTGEQFMEFAIPGFISKFCTPNGLLTLTEYLIDYGNTETRKAGSKVIKKELERFDNDKLKQECVERLNVLETSSERDLYF